MTKHKENLLPEHWRVIRAAIGIIRDMKHRLGSLESSRAGVQRENAGLDETTAVPDTNDHRLIERVERRLNRIDVHRPTVTANNVAVKASHRRPRKAGRAAPGTRTCRFDLTADLLGITRPTLYDLIKKYGIPS